MSQRHVEVVLPLALRYPLIYRVPEEFKDRAPPGARVFIPLGKKTAIGCVLGDTADKPHLKIRDLTAVIDEPPLFSELELKFLQWASAYYLTPIGEVLRHLAPPKIFGSKKPLSLETKKSQVQHPTARSGPALIEEQEKALAAVREGLGNPEKPILLHGITGSGKTEIYREAAAHVVTEGGQALILVPEISLTPQLVRRFQDLGVPTAAYHSALTPAQRQKIWRQARQGGLSLVIATRSGIFLKFPNLKLIVVDEEHDGSYKQEERFCYHARDLALWRASEERILTVLGSATPSLESLYRVEKQKMACVRLGERPTGASLPVIELIDRRRDPETVHPIFSPKT